MNGTFHVTANTKQGLCGLRSGFDVSTGFSLRDNHSHFYFLLWCNTHFSSPITMRCRNDGLLFLVRKLPQVVQYCSRFSSVSSCGTTISSLQVFPIWLRCSWIVRHDALNSCAKFPVFWLDFIRLQSIRLLEIVGYVSITICKPLKPQLTGRSCYYIRMHVAKVV